MHPNHTGIVTACEGVAVPARGAGCIGIYTGQTVAEVVALPSP